MTKHEIFEAACDEHRQRCEEGGRAYPTKTISTGESPLPSTPEKTLSLKLIEAEGFVIYGPNEPPQPPPAEPRQSPVPVYSDDCLTRNSRRMHRTFMIEEIYKDGKTTNTFRAVRQGKDRRYDIGVFTTLDEAVELGKESAPASLVL